MVPTAKQAARGLAGEQDLTSQSMKPEIEREVTLPRVTVQLATVNWGLVEQYSVPHSGYILCQRLSDNHSPLRIGNIAAREAFPRVRSVGFLPPGCSVRLFPVGKPLRVLNCVFDKDFFERTTGITQRQWEEHTGSLVSIKNKRLEILMQEIYAELVQPGFGHDLLVEAASTMMLVELARYARQLDRKKSKYGASLALSPWQLRRIQERIQSSLELGYPNLSELADICGISQSHLMRSFKASTGWQIHKYIAEERLKVAKMMLAQEHFSCKEVSLRLGFKSPAYFSTAFLRMTGKTPKEYQRQARTRDVSIS
jgi:AraC family transcriptional regulator